MAYTDCTIYPPIRKIVLNVRSLEPRFARFSQPFMILDEGRGMFFFLLREASTPRAQRVSRDIGLQDQRYK